MAYNYSNDLKYLSVSNFLKSTLLLNDFSLCKKNKQKNGNTLQ